MCEESSSQLTEQEKCEIINLPADWTPQIQPSAAIDRLHENRKLRHNEAILNMSEDFNAINQNIEKEIRIKAEALKQYITESKLKIIKIYDQYNHNNFEDYLYTKSDDEILQDTYYAQKITEERKCQIEEFYLEMRKLERCRSNQIKNVLRKFYKILFDISFMLPYKLEAFFEHEIMRINQSLLSNIRCYEELRLKLNLQADFDFKEFMDRYEDLKTIQKEIRHSRQLKEACCRIASIPTIISGGDDRTPATLQPAGGAIHMASLHHLDDGWFMELDATIIGLKNCAKQLINSYRTAITKVYCAYFEEIREQIEKASDIAIGDPEENESDRLDEYKQYFTNTSHNFIELQELWDNWVEKMFKILQSAFIFLTEVAHLWDAHWQRTTDAKRIVRKHLENTILQNDTNIQEEEMKLNIAIDALRQESKPKKLHSGYDSVIKLLDNLKKSYMKNHDTEYKTLETYQELIHKETKVLESEIKRFIHTKGDDIQSETDFFQNDNLPKTIIRCHYQVEAIQNWKFGLGHAVELYLKSCTHDLKIQATSWISDQYKEIVKKRLNSLMLFLEQRYERIRTEVYEIRLNEIEVHSERYRVHEAGVKKSLHEITTYIEECDKDLKKLVDNYDVKLSEIDNKTTVALRSDVAENCLKAAERLYEQLLSDIDNKHTEIVKTHDMKINRINNSNLDFIKAIRLFAEGGNFGVLEAAEMEKHLLSLNNNIESRHKNNIKVLKKIKVPVVKAAKKITDTALTRFDDAVKELLFDEKCTLHIKTTQNIIKQEVFTMKCKLKKVQSSCEDIAKVLQEFLRRGILNGNYISETFDTVLSVIEDFNSYLKQPETMFTVLPYEKKNLETDVESIKSVSQKSSKTADSKKRNTKFQDYQNLLFDITTPLQTTDTFILNTARELLNSFLTVQEFTKEFYTTKLKRPVVNVNLIPPRYDDCMEDILTKYKYYHIQCENVWLDCVNEFIQFLITAECNVNKFCEIYFKKTNQQQINEMTDEYQFFLTNIKNMRDNYYNDWFKTGQEFLSSHKHYKNKMALVVQLDQEVMEFLNGIPESVGSEINDHKIILDQHCQAFEEEMVGVQEMLCSVQNKFKLQDIIHNLIRQINQRLASNIADIEKANPPNEENQKLPVNKKQLSSIRPETNNTTATIVSQYGGTNTNSEIFTKKIPKLYRISTDMDECNQQPKIGVETENKFDNLKELAPSIAKLNFEAIKELTSDASKHLINITEMMEHFQMNFTELYVSYIANVEKIWDDYETEFSTWRALWQSKILEVFEYGESECENTTSFEYGESEYENLDD